jgi:ribonuclease HI
MLKNRQGKTYFNILKGHSGIYGNEQADRLAYLGSQKHYVKEKYKKQDRKIDFYFEKMEKTDDSENAKDTYYNEFVRILQLLEGKDEKLTITTRNKNIYLMFKENRIDNWLKNNWCSKGSEKKLKAPKELCMRINELVKNRTSDLDVVYVNKKSTI